MGKKGKKGQAAKPKKLTPKEIGKRLDALVKKLQEELKGADLFAPLLPMEDCPICFIPLPRLGDKKVYKYCCGKEICLGCDEESIAMSMQGGVHNDNKSCACPFCRAVSLKTGDVDRILEKSITKNDRIALFALSEYFLEGSQECSKDELKAVDCLIRAVELGSADSCGRLAAWFRDGTGVPQDMKRAILFSKVGALRGDIHSHHNMGVYEYWELGNIELAIRHWKIGAEAGSQISLDYLKNIFHANGEIVGKEFISKDYLDKIYRDCHAAQENIKSEAREKHYTKEDRLKC